MPFTSSNKKCIISCLSFNSACFCIAARSNYFGSFVCPQGTIAGVSVFFSREKHKNYRLEELKQYLKLRTVSPFSDCKDVTLVLMSGTLTVPGIFIFIIKPQLINIKRFFKKNKKKPVTRKPEIFCCVTFICQGLVLYIHKYYLQVRSCQNCSRTLKQIISWSI